VLDLLAVAGRPVSPHVLEQAAGLDGEKLRRALGVLARRQMVAQLAEEEVRYRISHDRMREALYGEIGEDRRRDLHLRTAQAVEAVYPEDLNEHLYELAFHYGQAGSKDEALAYALAGGKLAKETHANSLALELFDQAHRIIEDTDPDSPRLAGLSEEMGDCHHLMGNHVSAMACYEEFHTHARGRFERARVVRKIGEVHLQQGDLGMAQEKIWTTIELLGGAKPGSGTAYSLAILGSILLHLIYRFFPWTIRHAAAEERRRLAELSASYLRSCYIYYFQEPMAMFLPALRAHNLAIRLGTSRELAHAASSMGQFYGLANLHRSGLKYCQHAVDMALELNSTWLRGVGIARRGMIQYYRSHWTEALENLLEAKDLFVRCGDMLELGGCHVHIFAVLLAQGRFRRAIGHVRDYLHILRRTDQEQFLDRGSKVQFAYLEAKLGEKSVEQATSRIEALVDECEETRDMMGVCVSSTLLGDLYLSSGMTDRAIAALERGLEIREANDINLDYDVGSYPLLAMALMERTRDARDAAPTPSTSDRIPRLVRKSLRMTRRRHPNYRSHALLSQALYEWSRGRAERAEGLFAASRAVAEQQRARAWLGEICYVEGRCLLEMGAPYRDRAKTSLERALALFEECRSVPDLEKTYDLLVDL